MAGRSPLPVGLCAQAAKSIVELCFTSVCHCWPLGPAERALRCLTPGTDLSGFYYSYHITGVPESSPSASSFLTMWPFVLPPVFNRLLTTAFFFLPSVVLTTLYTAITYIKDKCLDILFNDQSAS